MRVPRAEPVCFLCKEALTQMDWNKLPETVTADAALVLGEINRRYLTGFPASDGTVALTRGEAVFYTDSRYIEAAQAAVKTMPALEPKDGPYDEAIALFQARGVKTAAVEIDVITVAQFRRLREIFGKAGIEIVDSPTLSEALRRARSVKTREQTDAVVRAQRIAEAAFEVLKGEIKPGKTEKELQLRLDFLMLSMGAEALSFETIVAAGENGSKPHAVPSDRPVREGDFITFDFGAVWNGYHSDMTRTVCLGDCGDEMKRVYELVLRAQTAVIEGTKAGMTCQAADALARDIIADAGYGDYFRHGTGHGVGLEIHEPPYVSPKSRDTLEPGNIVTAEPGIYLPGRFGVRIEDMLLITPDGCEDLTDCDKQLIRL